MTVAGGNPPSERRGGKRGASWPITRGPESGRMTISAGVTKRGSEADGLAGGACAHAATRRTRQPAVRRISVVIDVCRGITPRSPAGGLSEVERSSPSQLHFKGFKGDGFLKHRARQVQQLVIQRARRRLAVPTKSRSTHHVRPRRELRRASSLAR